MELFTFSLFRLLWFCNRGRGFLSSYMGGYSEYFKASCFGAKKTVLLSLVILIFLFEKVLYPEYAVFVLFLKHQGVSRLFLEFLGFLAEKPSVLVFFQGALNFWRYGVVG